MSRVPHSRGDLEGHCEKEKMHVGDVFLLAVSLEIMRFMSNHIFSISIKMSSVGPQLSLVWVLN